MTYVGMLGLNDVSTAPVAAFTLARRGRRTPLTVVKSPPM